MGGSKIVKGQALALPLPGSVAFVKLLFKIFYVFIYFLLGRR